MTAHDVLGDGATRGGFARREALRLTGALGLAAAGIVATCDHAVAAEADAAAHAGGPRHRLRDPRVYTFRIGDIKIVALYDGFSDLPTRLYAATAPDGVPEAMLAARGLSPDVVRNPSIPILVDTGSDLVLLDAGWGAATAPFAEDRLTGGEVVRNLAAAGYRPEDVSHVVVSHASADHIGGLIDERGQRVFRRARTVFMRREWEFWSREEPTPRLNALTREWFLTYTRRIFPVVAPSVQLLDRDTELVPGVRVISAPGHTPGHLVCSSRPRRAAAPPQ
jgi:glyoxylase-like metal-dependent hydrolase (beta-lactamase superfamily II)